MNHFVVGECKFAWIYLRREDQGVFILFETSEWEYLVNIYVIPALALGGHFYFIVKCVRTMPWILSPLLMEIPCGCFPL